MHSYQRQLVLNLICLSLLVILNLIALAAPKKTQVSSEREAATKLLDAGNNTEAIRQFRQYLKTPQHHDDAEGWLLLGIAQFRNNQRNDAKESFQVSLKLNPNSDLAHSSYASVLFALGKYKDAEAESELAVKLNPNNSGAIYLRGIFSYQKRDFTKTLIDADTAIQLNPKLASAYILKAQAIMGVYYSAFTNADNKSHNWKTALSEFTTNIEIYLRLAAPSPETIFWQENLNKIKEIEADKSSLFCPSYTANADKTAQAQGTPPQVFPRERAKYTDEARKNGIQGIVILRGIFDTDGHMKNIFPLNYLGGGLTNQAIKAAQQIRFKPATRNGQPICLSVILEYTFALN